VVPSKKAYGIKGQGYQGDGAFRFDCSAYTSGPYAGLLGCFWFPGGLGMDGANGNPSDVGGQYGWMVELVEEGPDHTWARVQIRNQQMAVNTTYTPAEVNTPGAYNVTYTTVVKNEGTTDVPMAGVTYTLPSQLSFVSLTAEGYALGTGALPIGTVYEATTSWRTAGGSDVLWAGSTVTLTLVASGNATMPETVSTSLVAYDGAAMIGPLYYETMVNVGADLRITKSAPATANNGDVINYTITYQNAGNIPAENVVITDTLPTGVTTADATVWTIGTLAANSGVVTITLPVTVTATGVTLVNTVDIATTTPLMASAVTHATASTDVAGFYYVYLPAVMKNQPTYTP
jgi:uncharacterized repeat protein (TIGR01451 family)